MLHVVSLYGRYRGGGAVEFNICLYQRVLCHEMSCLTHRILHAYITNFYNCIYVILHLNNRQNYIEVFTIRLKETAKKMFFSGWQCH